MKAIKVKTDVVTNNYLDSETGEIIEQSTEIKHHKIVVDSDESFFWTYNALLSILQDLTKTEIKLLQYACLNAQWNKNIVSFGKPVCEDIKKSYDISYQTVKDTVSSLKTKNIFIPLGSGYYRINPRYYWRGNSSERKKTMKFILEVECPECLESVRGNTPKIFGNSDDFLKQK